MLPRRQTAVVGVCADESNHGLQHSNAGFMFNTGATLSLSSSSGLICIADWRRRLQASLGRAPGLTCQPFILRINLPARGQGGGWEGRGTAPH